MAKKYIARLDGKIVGKRTTASRTYTHAVVVQKDIERARKRAYDHVADDIDRDAFKFYSEEAVSGESVSGPEHNAAWRAECAAKVEGGLDGYVARVRNDKIEQFKHDVARGVYEPHAATWCGRLDLAHKEVAKRRVGQHADWYNVKDIWIVEAEEVRK